MIEDDQPELGMRPKTLDAVEPVRSKKVLTKRRNLSGSSGFLYAEVMAVHSLVQRCLTLTCTVRTRPGNHGPGIHYRKSIPWERKMTEMGKARKVVDAELDKIQAEVEARQVPERGLFLDRCNVTGMAVPDFIEGTCSKCSCWYCEVAS